MSEQAIQDVQIAKVENNIQEKIQPVVEIKKEETKKTEEKTAQVEESPQDVNWRKFRENREIERKKAESDAIARNKAERETEALKAALDAVLNKQPPQQQYHHEQVDESEEQRIEKLVVNAIAKRDAAVEQQRKQHEAETFANRLRSDYKDFDQVCSAENLDYLDFHYPEVTAPFSDLPDGYNKWSKAYKAVKRFVPNTDSKKDQAKAENNQKKPQSLSSATTTPTGYKNLDQSSIEARRAENWTRMQKQMKGLS